MASSPTPVSDSDLIERMNAIRNTSERHVERLHHEVERLKDWREHVKARPFLAVGASAVAGFWLVSRLTAGSNGSASSAINLSNGAAHSGVSANGGPSSGSSSANRRVVHHKTDNVDEDKVANKTSLKAGAMAMVGTLASTAIRMAATHYLRAYLK
jgi:hypothetical protein